MPDFGKCPVCKMAMSIEMVPAGFAKPDNKGKQKRKGNFGVVLPQVLRYSLEMSLRAMVASGRSLYYYCGNEACPAHYTPAHPHYFKKTAAGTFELVGDSTGLKLSALQGQYKKPVRRSK